MEQDEPVAPADMVMRSAVCALSFGPLFQPFIDFGVFDRSTPIEMGPLRWIYTLLPVLSFVAVNAPVLMQLKHRVVALDIGVAICAVTYSIVLICSLHFALFATMLGEMFLMAFMWGALGMEDYQNARTGLGAGGWMLLAATAVSIVQVYRMYRSS